MTNTAASTHGPDAMPPPHSGGLRVLIGGASGLVGTHARRHLEAAGHSVSVLTRGARKQPNEIPWDPTDARIDEAGLAGFDTVLHLSGESVMGRWTAEKRRRIRDSRVGSTHLLCAALARLDRRPRAVICASAIGYYGDRGAAILTEQDPPGAGFLAEACQEWEQAADPARTAGIRVVHLRLGVVLSPAGGALAQMLRPFRFGLGGVIGSGDQWMSWIGMADLLRAIIFVMERSELSGAINVVAPNPVTNRELPRTLGSFLRRPTVLPVPAVALRLALGKMADETILASARVLPARLIAAGFQFAHPALRDALAHELK